jgi:hypothetical protein
VLPNHLGYPTEFIVKHIPTGKNPRAILIMPDNKRAFVANSLDDTLGIIDLSKMEMTGSVDLGGPKAITKQRLGEQLFHNAFVTFHRQYSCNSCHPDGHVDGMTYDIEADGIGIQPVDNRTLRGILDTAPFKWEGTNPSLSRQCGARLAVFFTRLAPFTPEQLAAVDYYVTTIPRPPNRFRPLGATLTPAQRRGKEIFDRTTANDGRTIPLLNRCATCHFPPYYTDRKRHDVGTKMSFDRTGNFDVPHLNNIYDLAAGRMYHGSLFLSFWEPFLSDPRDPILCVPTPETYRIYGSGKPALIEALRPRAPGQPMPRFPSDEAAQVKIVAEPSGFLGIGDARALTLLYAFAVGHSKSPQIRLGIETSFTELRAGPTY